MSYNVGKNSILSFQHSVIVNLRKYMLHLGSNSIKFCHLVVKMPWILVLYICVTRGFQNIQRFAHTLKQNFCTILCPNIPPKQYFCGTCLMEKISLNYGLLNARNRIQKWPFFLKIDTFWPLITLYPHKTTFLVYLWSCMCTTLVYECPPGKMQRWGQYLKFWKMQNIRINHLFQSVTLKWNFLVPVSYTGYNIVQEIIW